MARVELRPELCPPAVAPRRLAALRAAIETIVGLLDRREPAEAAIVAFNVETGHDYTAADFLTRGTSADIEQFAVEAARPAWPKVVDVTRDELVEIVGRLLAADDDSDYYVLVLQANVPHPHVVDLIFWPPPELADASPQRIVDAALRYRPFAL